MKKKSLLFLRLICLVLALAMVAVSLIACAGGNNNDGSDDSTAITTPAASDTVTVVGEAEQNMPAKNDYSGYKYRIWTTSNELGGVDTFFSTKDDGNTGEVISDALYARQIMMEEYYGIEVETKLDTELLTTLTTSVGSNDDYYDITIMPARKQMETALVNGFLTELSRFEELNLEASYWDQRIQKEYNIQGRLYTLEGDFSIVDELRTNVIVYNYSLYKQYDYDEKYGAPYSIVADGAWTLSLMLEMAEGHSEDKLGDGLGQDDTWGVISEVNAPYTFYLGSGMKTIVNSDEGLELTYNTDYDNIYNVIEDCMKLSVNPEVLFANRGTPIPSSEDFWTIASDMFMNGQALFRTTTLSAVTRLRDMKSDYGILPITKYNAKQDGYYCLVSADNHCPLSIPITAASHYEKTAELTEAYCFFSKYKSSSTLYSAFFDVMTYARICRTQDDIDMLTLVFNSKTFDLDFAAAITGTQSALWSLSKAGAVTTLSSSLAGIKGNSTEKLTAYFTKVIQNGDK